MNNWHAIIYGFIQGISEFLPVSSSGHLALLPHFFNIKDPGVVFDLLMHFGTALAIIIYFRAEILRLIKEGLGILKDRSLTGRWFFVNFVMATCMSVVFILIIKDTATSIGRSSSLIAANLAVFGVLMYLSDRCKSLASLEMKDQKNWKLALIIGFSQALAVFPGVSRSGITLTAGRFMKLSRVEASRFSFLLSLPIILASIAYKLPSILEGEATYVSLSHIALGTISSFVFGILTIHFFLKAISKIGLLPFAIYRVFIALLIFYLLIV